MGNKLYAFLAIGILAVASSWGISWQTSRLYQDLHAHERRTTLTAETQNAAGRVQESISGIQAHVQASLPYLISQNRVQSNEAISRFTSENPDIVGIQVFTVPSERSSRLTPIAAGLSRNIDPSFETNEKDAKQVALLKETYTWLRKSIVESRGRTFTITNLSNTTNLPVTAFAFRTKIEGSPLFSWTVVCIWQEVLLRQLPNNPHTKSYLASKEGDVLAAHDKTFSAGESLRAHVGFRSALTNENKYGISKSYEKEGSSFEAAYAGLPSLDLIVLSESDLTSYLTQMDAIGEGNYLWLAAILMGSLLVSILITNAYDHGFTKIHWVLERFAHGDFSAQFKIEGPAKQTLSRLKDLGKILKAKLKGKKDAPNAIGSSLASHLRHTLIPQNDIKRPALTVSGYYQPAKECGGTLWGHKSLDDAHEFIYMIDDSETGEPAALNMGLFYSTINTWLLEESHRKELSKNPVAFIDFLKELLKNHPTVTTSLAAQAIVVSSKENCIYYCGTGAVKTLVISNTVKDDRKFETIGDKGTRAIALPVEQHPLTAKGGTATLQKTPLRHNDRIVMFSRGLIDSQNPDGKPWGLRSCIASLQNHSEQSAKDFKTEVLASAFTFFRSTPIVDDIAFVAIEFNADAVASEEATETIPATQKPPVPPTANTETVPVNVVRPESTATTPPPPTPPMNAQINVSKSDMSHSGHTETAVPKPMKSEVTTTKGAPPPPPIPNKKAEDEEPMELAFSLNSDTKNEDVFSLTLEPSRIIPDTNNMGSKTIESPKAEDAKGPPPIPVLKDNATSNEPRAIQRKRKQFHNDDNTLANADPSKIEHPFTERPSQIFRMEPGEKPAESEALQNEEQEKKQPKGKGRYKIKLPPAG